MRNTKALIIVATLALTALACGKSDRAEGTAPSPEQTPEQAMGRALAGYEDARKLLVADTLDGLAEAAGRIQQAAAQAATAGGDHAAHLSELSAAAGALAAARDLEAARRAFGDVSRPVVAVLAADARLRADRHVFTCPMADGYDKWVQPGAQIENPYMGQRMLACGGPTSWD